MMLLVQALLALCPFFIHQATSQVYQPPSAGMIAWFKSENANVSWPSSVGSFVGTGSGNFAVTTEARNSATIPVKFLSGSTTESFNFGPVLTNVFSICVLDRYNGPKQGRILQGNGANYVLGHHWSTKADGTSRLDSTGTTGANYSGASGAFYFWNSDASGYTNTILPWNSTDWYVSCASNAGGSVYLDGHNIQQLLPGPTGVTDSLVINAGSTTSLHYSDWAMAEVIVWNRALSDAEMLQASMYLLNKIGKVDYTALPVGMYSWFRMEEVNNAAWSSRINGFVGTTVAGTANKGNAAGNGAAVPVSFISGDINAKFNFGTVLPPNFTMCSVSRYTGSNRVRVITSNMEFGVTADLAHGHFRGYVGYANYNGIVWPYDANGGYVGAACAVQPVCGSRCGLGCGSHQWLVACGSNVNSNFFVNGAAMPSAKVAGPLSAAAAIGVNTARGDNTVENSDWAVMELITWQRGLSLAEMTQASNYLMNKLANGVAPFFFSGAAYPGPGSNNYNSGSVPPGQGYYTNIGGAVVDTLFAQGTGISIAFTAQWNAFNFYSRVFDCGNGRVNNTFYVCNQDRSARIQAGQLIDGSNSEGTWSNYIDLSGQHMWLVSYGPLGGLAIWQDGAVVATTAAASMRYAVPATVARSQCYIGKSAEAADGLFQGVISNFFLFAGEMNWTTMLQRTACITLPPPCPANFTATTNTSAGFGTTCCARCSTFRCPGNFTQIANATGNTAAACCKASCRSFTCSNGYALIANAMNVAGNTSSVCCQDLRCSSFICPSGYILIANATNVIGNTTSVCCQVTTTTTSSSTTTSSTSSTSSVTETTTSSTSSSSVTQTTTSSTSSSSVTQTTTSSTSASSVTPTTTSSTSASSVTPTTTSSTSSSSVMQTTTSSTSSSSVTQIATISSTSSLSVTQTTTTSSTRSSAAQVTTTNSSTVTVAGSAAMSIAGTTTVVSASGTTLAAAPAAPAATSTPAAAATLPAGTTTPAEAMAVTRSTAAFVNQTTVPTTTSAATTIPAPAPLSVAAANQAAETILTSLSTSSVSLGPEAAMQVLGQVSLLALAAANASNSASGGFPLNVTLKLAKAVEVVLVKFTAFVLGNLTFQANQSNVVTLETPAMSITAVAVPFNPADVVLTAPLPPGVPLVGGLSRGALAAAAQALAGAPQLGISFSSWKFNPYGPAVSSNGQAQDPVGKVFSLSLTDGKGKPLTIQNLQEPLTIANSVSVKSYEDFERAFIDGQHPTCKFWDTKLQAWSTEGCRPMGMSETGELRCACTHLTSFAPFGGFTPLLNLGALIVDLWISRLLCSYAGDLAGQGMLNLTTHSWVGQPSAACFFLWCTVCILVYLFTAGVDYRKAKNLPEVEQVQAAHGIQTVAQEATSPCFRLQERLVNALTSIVCFFTRNSLWRERRVARTMHCIAAARLGVDPETFLTLQKYETALAEKTLGQLQVIDKVPIQYVADLYQKLAKKSRYETGFVEDSLRWAEPYVTGEEKKFVDTFLAFHPFRTTTYQSLHRGYSSRAILQLLNMNCSLFMSAIFFVNHGTGALGRGTDEGCKTDRPITQAISQVLVFVLTVIASEGPNGALTFLDRSKPASMGRQSLTKTLGKMLLFNFSGIVLNGFYLLFVASFVANTLEQSVQEWLLQTSLTLLVSVAIVKPFVWSSGALLVAIVHRSLKGTFIGSSRVAPEPAATEGVKCNSQPAAARPEEPLSSKDQSTGVGTFNAVVPTAAVPGVAVSDHGRLPALASQRVPVRDTALQGLPEADAQQPMSEERSPQSDAVVVNIQDVPPSTLHRPSRSLLTGDRDHDAFEHLLSQILTRDVATSNGGEGLPGIVEHRPPVQADPDPSLVELLRDLATRQAHTMAWSG